MSIATAITAAQGKVANAYTAVSNKGGTLPATQNLSNLPTAINSIPSGGSSPVITSLSVTPTTSAQTITAPSGTDGYSPVNVSAVTSSIDANITAGNIKKNVQILGVTGTYEGSGGYVELPSYQIVNGVANRRSKTLDGTEFSGITDAGDHAFSSAFYNAVGLIGEVDLSSLTTVSGQSAFNAAFNSCSGITSVDLSSLATVSGQSAFNNCFSSCSGITSVDLSSLTTVSGQYGFSSTFYGCSGITSVDLPSLTTVSGKYGFNSTFSTCTGLTTVRFSALSNVSNSYALMTCFQNCTNLENVYFNSLKTTSFGSKVDQFSNMMRYTGTSKTHTIHFPSNLQSKISGLTGYPLFGGTSGYVTLSFDLPAT